MLNIVLFGPPGSGKGTQAANLVKKYQLKHVSTGDLLRAQIKGATDLGMKAKAFMDKGELVPDDVIMGMIGSLLDELGDSVKGYIFDGFPRTIDQAKALDTLLTEKNSSIKKVLSLQVSEDEVVSRLLERAKDSGRADDADEGTIRNRMKVYRENTMPVADFYADQHKLADIIGEGEIENITASLCEKIDTIL